MSLQQQFKRKFKNTVMILTKVFYSIFLNVFNHRRIINNRFILESYYKDKLIMYIDPNTITHYLPVKEEINGKFKRRCGNSFICGGQWERSIKLIETHRKTKDMYELFSVADYRKTKAYSRHVYELNNNKLNRINEPAGEILDSVDKIEDYYCKNISLFNVIMEEGYLSQKSLMGDSMNEVGIAIGRNGELYRYGNGYHRMAIAKYLKLDKIPVTIKVIHRDWYQHCLNNYKCDPIEATKMLLSD